MLLKVDLEDAGAEAGELSCCSLREISVGIHCHQMLDILMLLLDNLITWQQDEVLLVNNRVEKLDHASCIVQVCSVELGRYILLNLK